MQKRTYDTLKYIALIVLPAVATMYATLAALWGWPHTTAIVGTIIALDTFLGALLGLESVRYANQPEAPRPTSHVER